MGAVSFPFGIFNMMTVFGRMYVTQFYWVGDILTYSSNQLSGYNWMVWTSLWKVIRMTGFIKTIYHWDTDSYPTRFSAKMSCDGIRVNLSVNQPISILTINLVGSSQNYKIPSEPFVCLGTRALRNSLFMKRGPTKKSHNLTLNILLSTFLKYIKLVDQWILRLWNCQMFGQGSRNTSD